MSSSGSSGDGPPLCSQAQHCEYFFGAVDGLPCLFHGDPDIAGIGIIVAFLVAAWLAFAVVLYTYFFVDGAISPNRMNQLDQYIISAARRGLEWITVHIGIGKAGASPSSHEGERAMHLRRIVVKRTLLSLSDQQLVTGIAVLSVGYAQISRITEYHFQLLSCFAWLSFTVYQCAAVVIESIFRMSRFMALWRGIWIVLMLILLFVSTLATFHDYWLYSLGTPSVCVYENIPGNYNYRLSALVLLTVFAILWGGLDILYGFFPLRSLTRFMRLTDFLAMISLGIAAVPIFVHQRLRSLEHDAERFVQRFAYRTFRVLCYPLAVLMAILIQLMTSRMLDLLRVWSMGLFYSSYIFYIRHIAPRAGLIDNEDSWAFGQAVAVFMLLLPFFGIIEAYLEESSGDVGNQAENQSDAGQGLPQQDLPTTHSDNTNEPLSTFFAQTRTLGPAAAVNQSLRRSRAKDKQRGENDINGADSFPEEHHLITRATDSSTLQGERNRDLNLGNNTFRITTMDSFPRLERLRKDWPIIEMLATFEKEHYSSRWFGPLIIGVVAVLWALATVLGLFLLIVNSF